MKLIWFKVQGYKRFRDPSKIHLDGKLVAIVGPNEAGKTSLLRALRHLDSNDPYADSGASQELTRGVRIGSGDEIGEWTFLLVDADKETLKSVPEAKDARWYKTRKTADGSWTSSIHPRPKRCLKNRENIRKDLTGIFGLALSTAETDYPDHNQSAYKIQEILDSADELSSSETSELVEFSQRILDSEESPKSHKKIAKRLLDHVEKEGLPSPEQKAIDLLQEREPKILFFSDDDRDLKSEYNLNSFFLQEEPNKNVFREPMPAALHNLAACAALDLESLHEAQLGKDRGKVATMLVNASERLSKMLCHNWRQSKLSLNVDLDGWRLQILLKSERGEYVTVKERSDGLRQFASLSFFIAQQRVGKSKPIVLIDEVERHLHYDAQADLVQMLASQDLTSKIIYTTHSSGCLPDDLGAGVRMVALDEPYSKIENWFWVDERPGFAPLLFAMGARTLSFVPIRYSLIAEGAADMILLPALIKHSLGLESLGYQVVPGLSSANPGEIAILDNESSRTAYLCDADEEGQRIKSKILSAGVPKDKVHLLPDDGSVLEDYIDINSYVNAINMELYRSGFTEKISEDELDGSNRPRRLEVWCNQRKIGCPSKRAIAYHLIENSYEYEVTTGAIRDKLRSLHQKICSSLELTN